MIDNDSKQITRYKWEYKNFLDFVRQKKVGRAIIYAKALGIDRRTFVHWLSQEELRNALISSIDEIVDGMHEAGKKDWRMYRELLDMLGVDNVTNIDLKSGGERINPFAELTVDELRKIINEHDSK